MHFGETLARFRRTPDRITMYRLLDLGGDTVSDHMAWDGTDWYPDYDTAEAAAERLDADYGPLVIQVAKAQLNWGVA